MASSVQIANQALAYLGVDPIVSLTEDSTQAKRINSIYELTRDSLLEEHFWNFAIKRASLAQLSETPPYNYSYYYQLPSDFIRIVEPYENMEYRIEGDRIASDESSMKIEYVARITDTAKFSDSFTTLFSLRLAADLAYALTGSASTGDRLLDRYNKFLNKTKTIDSQQGKHRDRSHHSWITSRTSTFGRPVYDGVTNA